MRVFLLIIFLFFSLPASSQLVLQTGGRMPDQMISNSWKSAKVYVPGLSGSPVKFNKVPKDKAIRAAIISASDYVNCVLVVRGSCIAEFEAAERRRRAKTLSTLSFD